jgi:hypothetical protein
MNTSRSFALLVGKSPASTGLRGRVEDGFSASADKARLLMRGTGGNLMGGEIWMALSYGTTRANI